jgi:ribose transport system substrate-binding protein
MRHLGKSWLAVAGSVAALAVVAGCGSSDDSSDGTSSAASTAAASTAAAADAGASTTAEDTASELHATVLDDQIAKATLGTPKTTVDVGTAKLDFAEGEALKVAFIGYGKGFDYTVPEYEAAEKEAEALDMDVTIFDPKGDSQLQVNQIQTVMNSGKYNAMVVYPLATDLDCDLVTKQAPAKGLLVVVMGYPACADQDAPKGVLTNMPDTVPEDFVTEAWSKRITEMASEAGTPQKTIIVTGPKLDYQSDAAVKQLQADFKAAGNISVDQVVYTDYTRPDALVKMQDALQRNSDATMVVATMPEGSAGAQTAIRAAGKKGKIKLYGFGANEPQVKALDSGELEMSVPYYPYTNVKAAYQALALARAGEKVDSLIPYAGHKAESMREPGDEILFVTPENADAYASKVMEF